MKKVHYIIVLIILFLFTIGAYKYKSDNSYISVHIKLQKNVNDSYLEKYEVTSNLFKGDTSTQYLGEIKRKYLDNLKEDEKIVEYIEIADYE